jgi:DNA-directed RNA polymerase subunit RPC12/RpoP
MNDAEVSIKCKKCNETFQPDIKTRGDWVCPNCKSKNPNMKRHYRSVADLYILWLVVSAIVMFVHLKTSGFDLGIVFTLPFLTLLLVAIIFVYKSKTPWTDNAAKILIWLVFGISLGFKLIQVAEMLLAGNFNIPFMISFGIIYVAIFSYLFWLHSLTKKYI